MATTDYVLGRGVLSIGAWTAGAYPGTLTAVGNCPKCEFEVTEEKLDHYSSQAGVRAKDKSVTLESGYNVTFELDEITAANIAMFVKGTVTAATASENSYIAGNTLSDAEYALKFVTANAAGEDQIYYFWRVSIAPGGPFGLVSDDWSTLSFTGEGLKVGALGDAGADPDTYYFKVEFAGTATG